MAQRRSTASSHSNVVDILKGFKILKDESASDSLPVSSTGDSFLALVKSRENVSSVVNLLFPGAIPLNKSFFERLGELRPWIGFGNWADEAIGIVWSEAIRRLSPDDQLKLLDVFALKQDHYFFQNVTSLEVVIKNHVFPATFLADWFTKLMQIVERDMGSDLWKSIVAVCEHHPQCATEVIWRLIQPPEPRRLKIVGVMLGSLRHLPVDENIGIERERLMSFFEDHSDEQFRSAYNWSWARTARRFGITSSEIEAFFFRADRGTETDLETVVSVVCCICLNDNLAPEVFNQCIDWVDQRVDPLLPVNSKYHIVNAARFLSREQKAPEVRNINWEKWIIGIQPVSAEEAGTWGEIEMILTDFVKRDFPVFENAFEILCQASGTTLLKLMRDGQSFGLLINRLQDRDVGEMVGSLATSRHTPTRRMGLYLFDRLEIQEIPEASLDKNGDLGVKCLFYETQRTFLDGQTLGRIFVSLLPRAILCGEQFKTDVLDEIKLQARNFAGGCAEVLKSRGNNLPEILESIAAVEEYFQRLKAAHEGGVNMMAVAGHLRASRLYRRRFSRQVSGSAKKHSPLFRYSSSLAVLYANSYSSFVNGSLEPATPLVSSTGSLEIPIVEFCDPEEMALRRIHASAAIQSLLNEEFDDLEEAEGE